MQSENLTFHIYVYIITLFWRKIQTFYSALHLVYPVVTMSRKENQMKICTEQEQLLNLENENQFQGELPKLLNSKIIFRGSGNILVCDKNVTLTNSTVEFNGNHAIVYLNTNRHVYKLNASLNNDTVLYIEKNNYINQTVTIVLSEQKHCFIGNDNLFSLGVWIRNADPHLVYSAESLRRINLSKSIYIGDHVWIGQNAMLLKGTEIDSGSIVGGMSVVAGKKILHNESWAGNPCKKIKSGIFWEGSCVHGWTENDTQRSIDFSIFSEHRKVASDEFIFFYESACFIPFQEIECKLSTRDMDKKIEYLKWISNLKSKNRFARKIIQPSKSFWKKVGLQISKVK